MEQSLLSLKKGAGSEFAAFFTRGNCRHVPEAAGGIRLTDIYLPAAEDNKVPTEHAGIVLNEVGISSDTWLSLGGLSDGRTRGENQGIGPISVPA